MDEPDRRRRLPPPGSISAAGTVSSLVDSLRVLGDRFLGLVALESKQAGVSLAFMLGFGLAAAVLVITGWLALVACFVLALVDNNIVGWPVALLIAALLSFAGAGALVVPVVRCSKDLLFTATRRQLRRNAGSEAHHE